MSLKNNLNSFISSIGSIYFLFIIIILIVIACIAGSLIPLEMASIYVFKSFWFYGLMFCLCVSILCACIRQWPFTRRKLGFILIHFSILIILCGSIVGNIYGKKGYIELVESQITGIVKTEDGSKLTLPFKIKLNDFMLERHQQITDQQIVVLEKNSDINSSTKFNEVGRLSLPNDDLNIEVLQIEPDFIINENQQATSQSEYWNNPAIKVKIDDKTGWLFANHGYHGMAIWKDFFIKYICNIEGGEIKDYKSNISIIKDDKTVLNKTIEVNKPLVYEGYKFYQYSFNPENLRWTALQVKTDPGVPIVYGGYIVLIIGIFFNIYFITKSKKELN